MSEKIKNSEKSDFGKELYTALNNKHQLKGEIIGNILNALGDNDLDFKMIEDVLRDILKDIDAARIKIQNDIPF